MSPRICTPIIAHTLPIFLQRIAQAQKQSELIELRVDSIQSLVRPEDVVAMRKMMTSEMIFTFRALEEGGMSPMPEDARCALLQVAIDLEFPYVDIEHLTTQSFRFEKSSPTQIVLSSHNFTDTPSFTHLHEHIVEMSKSYLHPAVIKIATTVDTDADLRTLYTTQSSHYQLSTADYQLLLIGMGKRGKMTRILGPLLGAPWTYAALPSQTTAPGQLSFEEMKNIYTTLDS